MLTTLKGKIISVTKTSTTPNQQEPKKAAVTSGETASAGAEILRHFQEQWVDLHNLNEENAKKASAVSQQTKDLQSKVEKQRKDLTLLSEWMFSLSHLKDHLDNVIKQLLDVNCLFDDVESKLSDLESLIEEREAHLRFEKSLTNQQELNSRILQERQKVFQEAFDDDLQMYKQLGTIPKIEKSEVKTALLEEIQLDFNEQELENFLGDT